MKRAGRWAREPRNLAIAGCGVLALAVVVTPWYALDEYVPNGWDATWWARIALIAAVLAIVAFRRGNTAVAARRGNTAVAVALIVLALACVVYRTIALPDFGFGFDGLDVPVERRWGLWLALAAAVVALAGGLRQLGARRAAD